MLALQALFEVDAVDHEPEFALMQRLVPAEDTVDAGAPVDAQISSAECAASTVLPPKTIPFCRDIFYGALNNRDTLDEVIQRIAVEWPIDQMAPVDRNILRLAAYEIVFSNATPPKVAINEAVELAKLFGSDSSSRFVNGVLGTLLNQRHQIRATVMANATVVAAAPKPGKPSALEGNPD